MQVVFATEHLTRERFNEAFPLLVAHWKEVAHFQDIPLEPDFAAYEAAQRAGILRFFTARRPGRECVGIPIDGDLLGYACFFVRTNPHYASSLQAVQDVVYLDPTIRGLNGWKFLNFCDKELIKLGVEAIYHHVKALHDFGPLLNRMGYELVDQIYARRIDHGRDRRDAAHLGRLSDLSESDQPGAEGAAGEDAGRPRQFAGSVGDEAHRG